MHSGVVFMSNEINSEIIHKWTSGFNYPGNPHVCNPKPHWWHSTKSPGIKKCCDIYWENVTCPDCLKLKEE